jgi:hypothetical protein
LKTILLALQILRVTGNLPADLYGPIDTRPGTWGRSEARELPITFNPPPGMSVYIIRIRGDMVAGVKLPQNQAVIPENGFSWTLFGVSTTAKEGSEQCNWCADNALMYIQDGLRGGEVRRTPFDWDIGQYLGEDNTMVLKIATYLNTIDLPIHIEATWQAEFEYRKK